MITPLPGIVATKPGLATLAFPGIEADILNEKGEQIQVGGGLLAITRPWPGMLRGIYGDTQRYVDTYWSKWDKETYFPGDGAKRDAKGYFWILGRVDDVLNVSGHRIGTMEIEGALVDHHDVAEAAVIGKTHEIKGQAPAAFVTLKGGIEASPEKARELIDHVGEKIGHIAKPDSLIFSAELPKTRSGKIMRRLLRDIAEGKTLGDTTTLTDPAVVESLKSQYEHLES
jgi:acetyl-CoA synthetase